MSLKHTPKQFPPENKLWWKLPHPRTLDWKTLENYHYSGPVSPTEPQEAWGTVFSVSNTNTVLHLGKPRTTPQQLAGLQVCSGTSTWGWGWVWLMSAIYLLCILMVLWQTFTMVAHNHKHPSISEVDQQLLPTAPSGFSIDLLVLKGVTIQRAVRYGGSNYALLVCHKMTSVCQKKSVTAVMGVWEKHTNGESRKKKKRHLSCKPTEEGVSYQLIFFLSPDSI